jgi:CRP/FNR family cyclic AMP-dependent transcriptional regulator
MDAARLAGMPLFTDLNGEERAEVAARVHEVTVEADSTLALQGDNAYELFVIEEGEAEVRRDGETIATVREGDVVGEIGVLVTGTRRASVVATTPMRLVAMFSRDFRQIERQMPAVTAKLREIMRERVTRTSFVSDRLANQRRRLPYASAALRRGLLPVL